MATDPQTALTGNDCFACYGASVAQILIISRLKEWLLTLDADADVTPQGLLAYGKCYACYGASQVQIIIIALLALILEELDPDATPYSYTADFTGNDGDPLGADWEQGPYGLVMPTILSNKASEVGGNDASALVSASNFADGYVQGDFYVPTGTGGMMLYARASGDLQNYYRAEILKVGVICQYSVSKMVGGVPGLELLTGPIVFVEGATMKFVLSGATISLYYNGALIDTAVDATPYLTSGMVGFYLADAEMDNFSAVES